jgi:hypothetical protein
MRNITHFWEQGKYFFEYGGKVRGSSFVCHSEGATRSGSMTEWKIFSEMLIEALATEESPAQDGTDDQD